MVNESYSLGITERGLPWLRNRAIMRCQQCLENEHSLYAVVSLSVERCVIMYAIYLRSRNKSSLLVAYPDEMDRDTAVPLLNTLS